MRSGHTSEVRKLLYSGSAIEIGAGAARPARYAGDSPAIRVALGFAAIYLIWGSTYLGIRFAVETIPPFLMMALRHTLAGSVVYAWSRRRGAARPEFRHWVSAAVVGGILFLGGHGVLAWGEQRVPSGLAALMCATLPLWTVLAGTITGVEGQLGRRVWAGLLLGFAGVALLVGPDAFRAGGNLNLPAVGAVLLSALLWAVGTIWSKGLELPKSTALSAAMQMLMGGLSLMVASAAAGEWSRFHSATVSLRSWLALLYLIVFGSIVAFTVFTWLMGVSKPSRVSTYAYVNPVVAVFLGWGLASEVIAGRTAAAAAIILMGVALVNTRQRQGRENRTPLLVEKLREVAEEE
ncbi:MAG TPA: EamA family transporter [Terriglobales bacterium]|nr:EamA family transporter [Terriglobales bacterium]